MSGKDTKSKNNPVKSDETYVQIFNCHFYLNLTFDTKNYLAKYFLFLISRPAQEQSCLSPMLQTRFLFFFTTFIMCTAPILFLYILTSFRDIHKKISCLYDNLVVRNHLSKLTKYKGGCTQVALVQ